jgi:3-phytase
MALTFTVRSACCRAAFVVLFLLFPALRSAEEPMANPIAPTVRCADLAAEDQDDMCVWIHPTEPALSTIIASDKDADKLFVYNLTGKAIQAVSAKHPGNIDARYGFPLDKEKVDIVAFNARDDSKILVYKVVVGTRRLERVDNGAITTGENYGGTLYRNPKTGRFYFMTTSKSGLIEQYELSDDGQGKVQGRKVRSWTVGGQCEAAVADDEMGLIYIGEEDKGVWEVGGEPDDPAPGKLVIACGENGLVDDVEGLAIYYLPQGKGFLLVSNQSRNNYKVYRREGTHGFVGTFAVAGARSTDGLDVTGANLGPRFPNGLFACHSAQEDRCPVLLTPWASIAKKFRPELRISTAWNPRK